MIGGSTLRSYTDSTIIIAIILFGVICLAYANGANDNFKGVATLFGSGTTDYRRALTWATITTLLGSLTAVVLAETLLKSFTGKGLVEPELAGTAEYGSRSHLGPDQPFYWQLELECRFPQRTVWWEL